MSLTIEVKVQIENDIYDGILFLTEQGRRLVQVYNVVDYPDDVDFIGSWALDENDCLIEHFIMSDTRVVIGRLVG